MELAINNQQYWKGVQFEFEVKRKEVVEKSLFEIPDIRSVQGMTIDKIYYSDGVEGTTFATMLTFDTRIKRERTISSDSQDDIEKGDAPYYFIRAEPPILGHRMFTTLHVGGDVDDIEFIKQKVSELLEELNQ